MAKRDFVLVPSIADEVEARMRIIRIAEKRAAVGELKALQTWIIKNYGSDNFYLDVLAMVQGRIKELVGKGLEK